MSTARGGSRPGGCARGLGSLEHAARDVHVADHRGPERLQVRLARQLGVERLELSGRAHKQPTSVASAPLLQRDLPAQVLHLGGPQGVGRAGLDRDQQSQRRVERGGVALRPGSREQALRAATRFGRQHRRALQECRRRGQAPAALRSAGRALELLGDVLVGTRRGLGPVRRAAVGIDLCIGDLRQRAVCVLPLLQ